MFMQGDRVELINDFNNEPGLIPAGSQGTVVCESSGMFSLMFVRFDRLSDLDMPEYVRHNNLVAGLPMYPEELRRVK